LLLSVPDGSQAVVPLVGLLETCDANLLSGESGGLLRTPDSYDSLINSVGKAKPYMCPCLRDRTNYLSFLRSLVRGGMLVFSRKKKASVTPFFVENKGKGTTRLILDAREANQYFVDPTNPHMGSGSALANLVVPVGEDMYWATSDLKDAFYGMGIPEWLSAYFALPCLSASEVRSLGGFVGDVPQTTRFYPCLCVLPMGWSWSVYLCQRCHENILLREGLVNSGRKLVDFTTAPDLSCGSPVWLGYVDNSVIGGTDRAQVDALRTVCDDAFRRAGLRVHEETFAARNLDTLGIGIDDLCVLRPNTKRL